INLLNPKSVLFAAAVLVVIFPAGMSAGESLFVAANHLIVELLFYTSLAIIMSRPIIVNRYLGLKMYIDRVAAGVLGLLGVRLLISR
ncbi:MAG: LysE family transporter, partial [Methyloligellaceae bacterium]